ncbi:MAG: hypothetical protein J4G18_03550 [Anaerolineae bacterium]|nr:hypothetical protein [Anaerolineae bacterium]
MRYLHPVQAHEQFVAGGVYRFSKDDKALDKTEAWTIHSHADGERFIRIDMDARREEGKSILVEALQNRSGGLARWDLRYENANFQGGVKLLRASYQVVDGRLQVGFNMNAAERQYLEVDLPAGTLIDMPLLIFRGTTIRAIAKRAAERLSIFVPMFEHAQLFPGTLQSMNAPIDEDGDDILMLGARQVSVKRYRYRDRAALYWVDKHGVVIKRVNAFKQQEIVVQISNYVSPQN